MTPQHGGVMNKVLVMKTATTVILREIILNMFSVQYNHQITSWNQHGSGEPTNFRHKELPIISKRETYGTALPSGYK